MEKQIIEPEMEILKAIKEGLIRMGPAGIEAMEDAPKMEMIIINSRCN